jgi:hypothetical protein
MNDGWLAVPNCNHKPKPLDASSLARLMFDAPVMAKESLYRRRSASFPSSSRILGEVLVLSVAEHPRNLLDVWRYHRFNIVVEHGVLFAQLLEGARHGPADFAFFAFSLIHYTCCPADVDSRHFGADVAKGRDGGLFDVQFPVRICVGTDRRPAVCCQRYHHH